MPAKDMEGAPLGRGCKEAKRGLADDDYNDDDEDMNRFQSYDYDADAGEEGEEYYNEDDSEQQQTTMPTALPVVDKNKLKEQQAQAAAQTRKAQATAAQSQQQTKRAADEARLQLKDAGVHVPESAPDEIVLALLRQSQARARAQEQDLLQVASAVPEALVFVDECQIDVYPTQLQRSEQAVARQLQDEKHRKKKAKEEQQKQPATADDATSAGDDGAAATAAADAAMSPERRRKAGQRANCWAAFDLPDEYPDQPALVYVKGVSRLQTFITALLNKITFNNSTTAPASSAAAAAAVAVAKTNSSNKQKDSGAAANNNNDDDENDDEGMVLAGSTNPIFISDVVRFTQTMVDMCYFDTRELDYYYDEDCAVVPEGHPLHRSVYTENGGEKFYALCARTWSSMTGEHFTWTKPKEKVLKLTGPSAEKQAEETERRFKAAAEERERQAQELLRAHEKVLQRRRDQEAKRCAAGRLTATTAVPATALEKSNASAKHAPRAPPTPAYVLEQLDMIVQGAYENQSQFFTFSMPLPSGLPDSVTRLSHLKYLDLAGCRLRALPSLGHLAIEKLNLRKNNFSEVPRTVLQLRQLRVLDMAQNHLTEVHEGVGKLTELRVLDLSYNQISALCSFEHLQKLETLDVTDNNLSGIPAEVGALRNLWYLKMRANPMTDVPFEIYTSGIQGVKEYLTQMSTKSLPVSPSTINEDVAYLHLQIPGNEALRDSVFSGVIPAGYVPGAADAADNYAPIIGGDAQRNVVAVVYRDKRVDVSVDEKTGATDIRTVVAETPSLLFKTFRWLLAARCPRLLETVLRRDAAAAFGCETVVHLPLPLRDVEAKMFACFVLAPSAPYLSTNFGPTTSEGFLELVNSHCVRHNTRRHGAPLLSAVNGSAIPLSESLQLWVPVACGEDLGKLRAALPAVAGDSDEARGGNSSSAAAAALSSSASPPSELKFKTALVEQRDFLDRTAAQDPDVVEFLVGPDDDPATPPQRFRGHRSLLALRCGFFRTMFLDNMAAGGGGEGSSSSSSSAAIRVDDVHPSVFAALMTFLYTDTHGKKMQSENVVDLLFLSARYEVPRLRAMSEAMVGFYVEVENVCQVLQMAFFLQSQRLKDACVMFVVTNRFRVEVQPEWAELAPELREEVKGKIEGFGRKRDAEAAAAVATAAAKGRK